MKFKEKVFDAIKGFFIGTALLIPGVSAATIALITKVYDKLINNVSTLTKKFWPSLKVLIPIGIGVIVAIIAMWIPLKLATQHILFAIVCLFAGSVIGSVPDIASNIKKEEIKPHHYIFLIIAILCGMTFGILSYHCDLDVSNLFNPISWQIYLIIIPIGFLAAAGVVVPGISGSMLLLVLGFYTQILALVDKIKNQPGQVIGILACMAIGVIIGMICFSKLMKCLFKKYNLATFIWIIGLVVGSIFSLFYNHDIMKYYSKHGIAWWEWLLGAILLIGGFIGNYYLVIYNRKHHASGQISK